MSTPSTTELRALLAAATARPWITAEQSLHGDWTGIQNAHFALGNVFVAADAELIVAAVNALPDLLDRLERVEGERDRLREGLASSEHMRDVQRTDRAARALEDLRGRAEKAESRLAAVEALAHDMKGEHGQSWNSISGQRILNALATEAGERDE